MLRVRWVTWVRLRESRELAFALKTKNSHSLVEGRIKHLELAVTQWSKVRFLHKSFAFRTKVFGITKQEVIVYCIWIGLLISFGLINLLYVNSKGFCKPAICQKTLQFYQLAITQPSHSWGIFARIKISKLWHRHNCSNDTTLNGESLRWRSRTNIVADGDPRNCRRMRDSPMILESYIGERAQVQATFRSKMTISFYALIPILTFPAAPIWKKLQLNVL